MSRKRADGGLLVAVTLVMWVVGALGYALFAARQSGSWSVEEVSFLLFWGSLMMIPPLAIHWVLGVPALMLVQRALGGCRPVVVFPLVSGAIQAGFVVAVCFLLPTCSARETVLFSLLWGTMGLVGGVGYPWSCGYGRR